MRKEFIFLIFLVLVGMIYYSGLSGPFILDDIPNITEEENIRLTEFNWESLKKVFHEKRRVLAKFTFSVNYYFHGYKPEGFRILNILIHIFTGFILYFLLEKTLSIDGRSEKNIYITYLPLVSSLIWLVHPLHIQSVTYIVQRMNSLASLFYISSILLYIYGRSASSFKHKSFYYSCCLLAGVFSLLSKEIGATLPLIILLYEWFFFRDFNWKWLRKNNWIILILFLFGFFLTYISLGGHPIEALLDGYERRNFTLIERLMTQPRVVVYYMSLLIFPHPSRLNLDHDFLISSSITQPFTTILAAIFLLVLFGLAIYYAKDNRFLSFSLLWFFGNLLIESTVIPLELIFQYRTYLPSMFFVPLVLFLGLKLLNQRKVVITVVLVITALFSFWTYQRNAVWGSELDLLADSASKSPNKPRARYNYAHELALRGSFQEAKVNYLAAIKVNPNDWRSHNNIGLIYLESGQTKEAFVHFSQTLRIKPDHQEALINLSNVLKSLGNSQDAKKHLLTVLEINPNHPKAHNNLGLILVENGDLENGKKHYLKAIEADPEYAVAFNNLAIVLFNEGNVSSAIDHFSSAVRIDPNFHQARLNIDMALRSLEQKGDRN